MNRIVSRIAALDYLKLPMAFLVAMLHASHLYGTTDEVLVNGLYRMAVPVFILMSGFFFFDTVGKGAVPRWFRRVAILYLFWMLVYAPYWVPGYAGREHEALWLAYRFVAGFYHLWYVPGIMEAAVGLLILMRVPPALRFAAAGLCALGGVVLQYLFFAGLLPQNDIFHRNGIVFCFPFFVIGFEIARRYRQEGLQGVPYRAARRFLLPALALLVLENAAAYLIYPQGTSLDILLSLYVFCPLLLVAALSWPGRPAADEEKEARAGAHAAAIASLVYFSHVLILFLVRDHMPRAFLFPPFFAAYCMALAGGVYVLALKCGAGRFLRYIC